MLIDTPPSRPMWVSHAHHRSACDIATVWRHRRCHGQAARYRLYWPRLRWRHRLLPWLPTPAHLLLRVQAPPTCHDMAPIDYWRSISGSASWPLSLARHLAEAGPSAHQLATLCQNYATVSINIKLFYLQDADVATPSTTASSAANGASSDSRRWPKSKIGAGAGSSGLGSAASNGGGVNGSESKRRSQLDRAGLVGLRNIGNTVTLMNYSFIYNFLYYNYNF